MSKTRGPRHVLCLEAVTDKYQKYIVWVAPRGALVFSRSENGTLQTFSIRFSVTSKVTISGGLCCFFTNHTNQTLTFPYIVMQQAGCWMTVTSSDNQRNKICLYDGSPLYSYSRLGEVTVLG